MTHQDGTASTWGCCGAWECVCGIPAYESRAALIELLRVHGIDGYTEFETEDDTRKFYWPGGTQLTIEVEQGGGFYFHALDPLGGYQHEEVSLADLPARFPFWVGDMRRD